MDVKTTKIMASESKSAASSSAGAAKKDDGRAPQRIFLFDVDGTLTAPRKKVLDNMVTFLEDLRKKVRTRDDRKGWAVRRPPRRGTRSETLRVCAQRPSWACGPAHGRAGFCSLRLP